MCRANYISKTADSSVLKQGLAQKPKYSYSIVAHLNLKSKHVWHVPGVAERGGGGHF